MSQSSWPAVTSWPTGISASWPSSAAFPVPTYPATVTPAMWFDGRAAKFSDLAGTAPVTTIGAPFGNISEPLPLTSNWQAPSLAQRPLVDVAGAHIDYSSTAGASQALIHTSTPSVDTTNCTLAISFRARDASQSPQVGLLRSAGFGAYSGNGQLAFTYNNASANWSPGVPLYQKGQRVTAVFTVAATGLTCLAIIDGVISTATLTTSVTGTPNTSQFGIGATAGADIGCYGSVVQAQVVLRAVSNAEALAMALWMDAQTAPVAYPADAPLFAICGDSIARGNPGGGGQAWCWSALESLRGTYPRCEMLNAAVGGSGTAAAMYTPVLPYYLASRARNVVVLASGTNDIANGNGTAYVINNLFAAYDALAAGGWRPIIMTVLDRTGSLSIAQATFDSQRATVNAAILASGRVFGDLTGVTNLSAVGASANTTYFIGDGIHPNATGDALYAPVALAAMLAQAA